MKVKKLKNESEIIAQMMTNVLSDLNSFLNHIPEPMLVFGASGKIYTFNNSFIEFSGYGVSQIENLKFKDMVNNYTSLSLQLRRLSRITNQINFYVDFQKSNGSPVPVYMKFTRECRDSSSILKHFTDLEEDLYIGLAHLPLDIDRKSAFELQKSEQNRRSVINAIPDFMVKIDSKHKIVYYNIPSGFEFSVFNCSRREINMKTLFPGEAYNVAVNAVKSVFNDSIIRTFNYEIRRSEKKVKFFEVRMVPCSEYEIIAIIRDNTEKIVAQRNLESAEAKYRTIFENSPAGFFRIDCDGNFIEINKALANFLGYSGPERAIKKIRSIYQVINEDRSLVSKMLEEAGRIQSGAVVDVKIVNRNGNILFSRVTIKAVFDSFGNLIAYDGIQKDITQLKEKELNLSYEKMLLEKLIEQMPIGIAVKDIDNGLNFISWNQFLEKISGISSSDIIGRNEFDFCEKDEAELIYQSDLNALKTRELVYEKEVESDFFGKGRVLNITRIPIFDMESSKPRIILILVEDVTEERKLQKELIQSEKMRGIGQLAGGIAHDFNNQLMGIIGYAEMLKSILKGPEYLKPIEMIMTAAERSAELTNQLLAFSRKAKFVTTKVDIHQLIREVVSLLKHSIDKRVTVNTDLCSKSSIVVGDPNLLQNLLLNLALNSNDAISDAGEICFKTEVVSILEESPDFVVGGENISNGDYLKISVIDDGEGIAPENVKKIFEPFYTTKGDKRGTGMGLAAVFGTVQSHKGAISVCSELGKGTRLDIFLRWEKVVANYELDFGNELVYNESGSIYVIDDEDIVRNLVLDILKSAGFSVYTEKDPEAVENYYKDNYQSIDVVILDMMMPKLNGKQVFEIMRRINPDVKVILLSGYSYNHEIEYLLENGVLGFIQKPVNKQILIEKILNIMKHEENVLAESISESFKGGNDLSNNLEVIDMEAAIDRIGGSRELYELFAGKFIDKYSNFVPEALKMLKEQNYEQALISFHNIKGLSGNLGAVKLQRAALEVETSLRNNQSVTESQITSFSHKFNEVINLLNTVLKKHSQLKFSHVANDSELELMLLFLHDFREYLVSLNVRKIIIGLDKFREIVWPEQLKSDVANLECVLSNHNYRDSVEIVDKLIKEGEQCREAFHDENTLSLDLDV